MSGPERRTETEHMKKESNNIAGSKDNNLSRVTIRKMPEDIRPYEKCEEYGPQALSDAELLAVIIKSGSKKEHSIELAYRILNLADGYSGVNALYHLDFGQLTGLYGVGRVKALQILCIAELSRRMVRSERKVRTSFTKSSDIAMYFMEEMRHLEYEQTRIAFLDTKYNLICDKVLFSGAVGVSLFEPREIFIEALRAGAVYIVALHNHPSGDPSPSINDISATTRLKETGLMLGIRLTDHIIIGDNKYYSMHDSGII